MELGNIYFGVGSLGEQPALFVHGGGTRKLYFHRLLAAGWLVPKSATRKLEIALLVHPARASIAGQVDCPLSSFVVLAGEAQPRG